MSRILTNNDIESCKTSRGGFTAKTKLALTGNRKPKTGWIRRAVNTIITDDAWIDAQNGRSKKKVQINEEEKQIRKMKSRMSKLQNRLDDAIERIKDIEALLQI